MLVKATPSTDDPSLPSWLRLNRRLFGSTTTRLMYPTASRVTAWPGEGVPPDESATSLSTASGYRRAAAGRPPRTGIGVKASA